MITREDAAEYARLMVAAKIGGQQLHYAETVVALYAEVASLTNLLRLAEAEIRHLRSAEAPMPEVFFPASPADPEPFLLEVKPEWRQGRGRWWRGSASGYTNDWRGAGRYTVEDATDRGAFANHERFHAVSLETIMRAAVPGSV